MGMEYIFPHPLFAIVPDPIIKQASTRTDCLQYFNNLKLKFKKLSAHCAHFKNTHICMHKLKVLIPAFQILSNKY